MRNYRIDSLILNRQVFKTGISITLFIKIFRTIIRIQQRSCFSRNSIQLQEDLLPLPSVSSTSAISGSRIETFKEIWGKKLLWSYPNFLSQIVLPSYMKSPRDASNLQTRRPCLRLSATLELCALIPVAKLGNSPPAAIRILIELLDVPLKRKES